jgi:hypothetical protein
VTASRKGYDFAHGAEFRLPNGLHLLATYHPSLQNTNTGKLTAPMFLKVFTRARELAESRNSAPPKAALPRSKQRAPRPAEQDA